MGGVGGVNEARGLLAVDSLSEITMEKGIFDVHLSDRPMMRSSEAEDDADRSRFDDGAKGLPVVNLGLLCEATDHPPQDKAPKTKYHSGLAH